MQFASRWRQCVLIVLILGLMPDTSVAQIRGPELGYIFDKARGEVVPILGVPGASLIGDPLKLGVTLALAEISPMHDFALGVTQLEGKLVLIRFDEVSQPASPPALESVGSGATRIAFSDRGRAAAVLVPDRHTVSVLSDLPDSPGAGAEVDLRLAGMPEFLSLDDEGKLLILAVPESQGTRIYANSQEGGLKLLGLFGKVSGVKLLENKRLLVADRENDALILIQDVLGAAQQIRLATREDGINGPVAVEFSEGQERALVANAGTGSVASVSLEGGTTHLTFCDCTPTSLGRLDGNGLFRLTDLSEKPLFVLEANALKTRVVFVPTNQAQRERTARERRPPFPVTRRTNRLP